MSAAAKPFEIHKPEHKGRSRDFQVRIPARLLQNRTLSANARILRALIASYADGGSGITYVKPERLQEDLGWGRRKREQTQRELERAGWLRLTWSRALRGHFRRRVYELCDPELTVAHFERSGKTAQLISSHSQSQVKSSLPIILTRPQTEPKEVT